MGSLSIHFELGIVFFERSPREGISIFPDQRGGKQWSKYILVTLLQKKIIIFSDVTVEEDRSNFQI
jgi:hypothetical protein